MATSKDWDSRNVADSSIPAMQSPGGVGGHKISTTSFGRSVSDVIEWLVWPTPLHRQCPIGRRPPGGPGGVPWEGASRARPAGPAPGPPARAPGWGVPGGVPKKGQK